jgi:hypothetical protein
MVLLPARARNTLDFSELSVLTVYTTPDDLEIVTYRYFSSVSVVKYKPVKSVFSYLRCQYLTFSHNGRSIIVCWTQIQGSRLRNSFLAQARNVSRSRIAILVLVADRLRRGLTNLTMVQEQGTGIDCHPMKHEKWVFGLGCSQTRPIPHCSRPL